MTTRIICNQSYQLSKQAAQAINAVLDARLKATRVLAIMDKATWGTPADYASLAAELGLVDKTGYTALQQAADFYAIFQTATIKIDDPAVRELSRLDQG